MRCEPRSTAIPIIWKSVWNLAFTNINRCVHSKFIMGNSMKHIRSLLQMCFNNVIIILFSQLIKIYEVCKRIEMLFRKGLSCNTSNYRIWEGMFTVFSTEALLITQSLRRAFIKSRWIARPYTFPQKTVLSFKWRNNDDNGLIYHLKKFY
jgi:hypothetical protein